MTEGDLVKLLYDNCAFPALVTTESGRDLVARERATAFSKPVKMRSASWATCVRYFVKCACFISQGHFGLVQLPNGSCSAVCRLFARSNRSIASLDRRVEPTCAAQRAAGVMRTARLAATLLSF